MSGIYLLNYKLTITWAVNKKMPMLTMLTPQSYRRQISDIHFSAQHLQMFIA